MDRLGCLEDSSPLIADPELLRQRAGERGHLFFRSLLPPEVVQPVRSAVLAFCGERGWLAKSNELEGVARPGQDGIADDHPEFVDLQRRLLATREFDAVRKHSKLLEVAQIVLEGVVDPERGNVCRVMFPNAPHFTTRPHQDHYYVRGSAETWTAWIPLGDCRRELGPIAVVSGSHHWGELEHADRQGVPVSPEWEWLSEDFRCGDMLLFHSLTVHASLENRSGAFVRVSMDCRYSRAL